MEPNIDPQTRSFREESSLLSGRRCRASFGGGEGQGSLQVCFKAGRVELVAAPEGFAHVQPPPPPILANGCSPAQNSPCVLPAFGCVLCPTWRVPSSHLSQPCRLTGVWPQRGAGCVQQGYGRAELLGKRAGSFGGWTRRSLGELSWQEEALGLKTWVVLR